MSKIASRFLFCVFCCIAFSWVSGVVPAADSVDWTSWRRLPVYDSGRIMPLDTLARQIVQEVCGTARPFIAIDDFLLDELDKSQAEETRSIDSQQRTEEHEREEQNQRMEEARAVMLGIPRQPFGNDSAGPGTGSSRLPNLAERQKEGAATDDSLSSTPNGQRIARRIRFLIPHGGKYFEPYELLFSWLTEPEIWEYIPFLPASDENFRTAVLNVRSRNQVGYTLRFVSIAQLTRAKKYTERLEQLREMSENGTAGFKSPFDKSIERIEQSRRLFRGITYRPARDYPERCAYLIASTRDGDGMHEGSLRFLAGSFESLLALGGENRSLTGAAQLTGQFREIMLKMRDLSILLDNRDATAPPNPFALERAFEELLHSTDAFACCAATLMKRLHPDADFPIPPQSKPFDATWLAELFEPEFLRTRRPELQQTVLRLHYAVGAFRNEVQAAYLALYDNDRSVRVLPSLFAAPLQSDLNERLGLQPWISIQTVLFADAPMLRRFVDPDFSFSETALAPHSAEAPSTTSPAKSDTPDSDTPDIGATSTIPAAPATSNPPASEASSQSVADSGAGSSDSDLERRIRALEAGTTPEALAGVGEGNGSTNGPPATMEEQSLRRLADERRADLAVLGIMPANSTARIRYAFTRMSNAFSMLGEYPDSPQLFASSLRELTAALESTGSRIEPIRRQLVASGSTADSILEKTAYPPRGATSLELNYTRLAPFFWMWVFSGTAVVFIILSLFLGLARKEMIDAGESPKSGVIMPGKETAPTDPFTSARPTYSYRTKGVDDVLFRIATGFLALSIAITFLGGLMRSWITGWAPITNMYETVVLMGFVAALLGLWYALQPALGPAVAFAWRRTAFPGADAIRGFFQAHSKSREQDTSAADRSHSRPASAGAWMPDTPATPHTLAGWDLWGSRGLVILRILLMFPVLWTVLRLSYGEVVDHDGTFAALAQMFQMHDLIDLLVVLGCIFLIVWYVPRLLIVLVLLPILLFRADLLAKEAGITPLDGVSVSPPVERSLNRLVEEEQSIRQTTPTETTLSRLWWDQARSQIAERKWFILVGALVAMLAGLAASYNSEFNPQIRPLMAVLRSNFWLAVHVVAIIVAYSFAFVSWGVAMVALGVYAFGSYRRDTGVNGNTILRIPDLCERFAPHIIQMLRISVFLLMIGTILGARWADYSWGRFWGWDPKEVWALVTILFFLILLHGRIARYYDFFGMLVGTSLAAVVVLITWYGVNYVFKTGMHAYSGAGDSSSHWFLWCFIAINLIWCLIAATRYHSEKYGYEMG